MRRVLILLCALVGIAALIPNCGAVFAGGAQGQNAPSETKAYVGKVMGADTAGSNVINAQEALALLDGAPAQTTPPLPAQQATTPSNTISAADAAKLLGWSQNQSANSGSPEKTAQAVIKNSAATQPPPPRQPITLTKVDYDPFAPQPWYRQPINSGQQKMAAWLLLGVSVLMLFVITRMRWFNHLHVGWNRLIVALSGLWLLAVGSMLILVGGIPVEGWVGIVYVPVFTLWALYKLTGWVISGFAKGIQ